MPRPTDARFVALLIAPLLCIAPVVSYDAGLAAQSSVTPEGYEAVGDWLVSGDTDPFDDAVATNLMFLQAVTGSTRGITVVGLRCQAGPDGSSIELRVGHPYLIPSRSDRNFVQVRFGGDEARVEQGVAATGNQVTMVPIRWSDVEALVASPRLAVRITEGSANSNDVYTESWSDISGTAEAVKQAMEPCRPTE